MRYGKLTFLLQFFVCKTFPVSVSTGVDALVDSK
jgi:hypothetical protein